MLFLDPPVPASKVKMRCKTVVASFADAEPAVVWRWPATDTAVAFLLQPDNGKTALIKQQPGQPDLWLASFASPDAAHKALAEVSGALMGRAPWLRRIAIGALSVVGLIVVLFVAYGLLYTVLHQPLQVASAPPARTATPQTAQQALPGVTRPATAPALPPGAAVPGAQAPGGRPVDADQLYK